MKIYCINIIRFNKNNPGLKETWYWAVSSGNNLYRKVKCIVVGKTSASTVGNPTGQKTKKICGEYIKEATI